MKTCPVCQAKAFNDAPVCFGCLHRFDDEDIGEVKPAAPLPAPTPDPPPEFRIRFTPVQDQSGALTWSCAIET